MRSPAIDAFCVRLVLTIGHSLWEGTGVAIVAACLAAVTRSPEFKYRIYTVAMLALVGGPVVTFALLAPAVAPPPPAWSSPVASPAVSSAIAAFRRATASTGGRSPDPIVRPPRPPSMVPVAVPVVVAPAAPPAPPDWHPYAPAVAGVYAAGVAGLLVRLVVAVGSGRRLRRAADPLELPAVADLCGRMGLRWVPRVAVHARLAVPVVVGLVRPAILLPACVAAELSPEQLRAVLAHELAHVRRWDPLLNLVQRLVEAAMFFHPAVWFVSHRMRVEREHCADDVAAAALGDGPRPYAAALVRTAEVCRAARVSAVAVAIVGRASRLRRRVVRLLGGTVEPELRADRAWSLAAAAGLAAAVTLVVVTRAPAPARAGPAAPAGVAAALDELRHQFVFGDYDGWVGAVRTLAASGRDAVPALCEELRTTDHGRSPSPCGRSVIAGQCPC